jgi:adenine phosphoribosyltransferase
VPTFDELVWPLVREVPDFPEPGVLFRDLGPVFAHAGAFRALVEGLAETLPPDTDVLLAVEARGFLLGAAVALLTGTGVAPLRKPGKTPVVADRASYALEYGTATLELPAGMLAAGQRVVVVDDVLATGGTAAAAAELADRAGAEVTGISVVLELGGLGGRDRLPGRTVHALRTI